MTVNNGRAKYFILMVFVVSLVAVIGIYTYMAFKDRIPSDKLGDVIFTLLKAYTLPFVMILTFILKETTKEKLTKNEFFLGAIILCFLWNALLIGRLLYFCVYYQTDWGEDFTTFVEKYINTGSFLIVGFITYYFSSQS